MTKCFQFPGMSILDHGIDVWTWYSDLVGHLRDGMELTKDWTLPDWIYGLDLSSLPSDEDMREYLVYHDCGKPFCRVEDADGKQHFPGHEIVSYMRYKMYSDNELVADLIRSDMDVHRLKAEEIDEFLTRKNSTAMILAGLSEIHSNANALGGFSKDSFKIKMKKFDRIGKRLKVLAAP